MDPELRTWWRLLDDLPPRIGQVHAWNVPQLELPVGALHMHANPTLMVCLRGVVRVTCGAGPSRDLMAGDCLLISPGVWHEMADLRPGSVAFGVGFLTACADLCLWGSDRSWSGRLPVEPCRQLLQQAVAINDAEQRSQLIATLLRQVASEAVEPLSFADPPMLAMTRLLWGRFHQALTVDELLHASGLGRSRAYALFTQGYGTPPGEAIRTMRLWLAGSFLAAGCTVHEAARRSGWPSAATFGRAWQLAHGHPPRAAPRCADQRPPPSAGMPGAAGSAR